MVVEMQTLHGNSKQSGRSGLGLIILLETTHEHFELIIHRVADIKLVSQAISEKLSRHWTDIIPTLTKVNVSSGFPLFTATSVQAMGIIIPSL